jgi:hypothetical protein
MRTRNLLVSGLLVLGLLAGSTGSTAAAADGPGRAQARAGAAASLGTALPAGWTIATAAGRPVLSWRPRPGARLGQAAIEFYAGDRLLGAATTDRERREFHLDLAHLDLDPAEAAGLQVRAAGRRVDRPEPGTGTGTGTGRTGARQQRSDELPSIEVDPGKPGPYSTVTGEYELEPVQLPELFDPVEMQAVVVAPEGASGARPVVVLLHGHHEVCYRPETGAVTYSWPCADGLRPIPSYRGFLQTQQLLASRGYLTVSVSANAVNAQDLDPLDGGAQARSSLLRRHLSQWADWAGAGRAQAPAIVRQAPPADLSRVLLVGHSRGGEGVNRAAMDSLYPPPADVDGAPGPARWQIAGTVLIAPTAFGQNPVSDLPSLSILAGCDGDVADLQGQQYVDATRGVSHGRALHSSVYLVGANHNFFNTEWTPGQAQAPAADDFVSSTPHPDCTPGSAPGRLTGTEQQTAGATYIAAAAEVFIARDDRVRALLDGSGVRAASAGRARALSHALGAARTPLLLPDEARTGAGARVCRLVDPDPATSCGLTGTSPHAVPFAGPQAAEPGRTAVTLKWSAAGKAVQLRPTRPAAVGDAESVTMRIVVPARSTGTRLAVAVTDAAGRRADLGEVALDGLPGTVTASGWAQEVRLPLAPARRAGLDLTRVAALEFVPKSSSGQIWLLDAWGWRAGLPNPQTGPLTRIDLRRTSVDEGDDGVRSLGVAVTVTGEQPAQAWLMIIGPGGQRVDQLVTVRPGISELALPVEVTGNTRYGEDVEYTVLAKAVRTAVIGGYRGDVEVRNDDPLPKLVVTPVTDRVREGETLTWRVSLSAVADTTIGIRSRALAPSAGDELSSTDVDPQWLATTTGSQPTPSRPLSRFANFVISIRPGQSQIELSVPTIADDLAEPDEHLLFRLQSYASDPTGAVPAAVDLTGTVIGTAAGS